MTDYEAVRASLTGYLDELYGSRRDSLRSMPIRARTLGGYITGRSIVAATGVTVGEVRLSPLKTPLLRNMFPAASAVFVQLDNLGTRQIWLPAAYYNPEVPAIAGITASSIVEGWSALERKIYPDELSGTNNTANEDDKLQTELGKSVMKLLGLKIR